MESEVPDADAQEQRQEVTPPSTAPTPATRPATVDDEAPEADALEQAQEVPVDDDEERA